MHNFKKQNKISKFKTPSVLGLKKIYTGFFMTLLVSIQNLSKSYGSQNLFKEISFSLNEGDRMGLAGPNGAGKSTLLKILAGQDKADTGTISKKQGLKIAYATQSPEFVSNTLEETLILASPTLSRAEAELKAQTLLNKTGFEDFSADASKLSGGWKKRLDIARVFMGDPDVVLLDEPTNHLDLEGILWLEKFLKKERASYLIVSHDRYFLENVCTKMTELNRCFPKGIFFCNGNWSVFMERRMDFLEAQLKQERSLASTVRDEIEWMRKSPKARTTKSKSRMQKAGELIDQLQDLGQRNLKQTVAIDFAASERETRNLIVAKNLGKAMGEKTLFKGVDLKISPGSRLGIVGKNGTGKTTLLKILSGEIPQDMGTVKYAQDLKLVYFDQHREQVDSNISLREALSPNGDFVKFQGQEIHVNGWAKRFLFYPDRLNMPVRCLSGGERARILIARLMLQPADVLFLDEPTNDLDIPTLEVIENSLLEFPGAVLMITHDRCLMDRICTQIVGLGEGCEQTIYADYAQFEKASQESLTKKEKEVKFVAVQSASQAKKLSYKEKKELDGMESAIRLAEEEIAELQARAVIAATDPKESLEIYRKMGGCQKKLDVLYERWQVLLDME